MLGSLLAPLVMFRQLCTSLVLALCFQNNLQFSTARGIQLPNSYLSLQSDQPDPSLAVSVELNGKTYVNMVSGF